MPYDVAALRKQMQQQLGKGADPDEFKPKKAESTTDPVLYRFFILPPFSAGDTLKGGAATKSMPNFYIAHGSHWLSNKVYPCPRVWDSTKCEICNIGFDLLREEKNDIKRKEILSQWMPSTYYAVNIYFPAVDVNPEELRGKVKFFNAPKTCFDQWQAALMRENHGRDDDPKAFGVFFDESAAYLFQLEVVKHGKNNSYKSSKFVVQPGGKPVPMVRKADGSVHEEGLAVLLAARHNLWNKVREPNAVECAKIAKILLDGDDSADSSAGHTGFDQDEVKAPVVTRTAKEDALANEAPLVEAVVTNAVASASKSDDVSSDEIDALLQQLGEG